MILALVVHAALASLDAAAINAAAGFLKAHRPSRDARLSDQFFATQASNALSAMQEAPWAGQVPDDVFYEYVLPYCVLDEPRDELFASEFHHLRKRCMPLILGAHTPLDAALLLNEQMWEEFGVVFAPNLSPTYLSPSAVRAHGAASCTGLSILCILACRSCGVPARAAGVLDWGEGNPPGNHVWVEVWSDGAWHYFGAAEPTRANQTWFSERLQGPRGPTVLASAFGGRSTPTWTWRESAGARVREERRWSFPLPWRDREHECAAVDVTERYRHTSESGYSG